jgi:hypothetical protein
LAVSVNGIAEVKEMFFAVRFTLSYTCSLPAVAPVLSPTRILPSTISNFSTETSGVEVSDVVCLGLFPDAPMVEKFHLPAAFFSSTISGWFTAMVVTSSRLEKISGIRCRPTLSDPAFRNGPLLNAGSSLMVICVAEAPPLKMDASSLPIWTSRFSAVERLFSSLGRKLSTLMNNGTSKAATIKTPTILATIISRRFIRKCYQKDRY